MSHRNSNGRSLAERLHEMRGSAGSIAVHAIALTALGFVCLMSEPTATAFGAVGAPLGALLLIRSLAVRCGSNKPCKVELGRARVRPLRHR